MAKNKTQKTDVDVMEFVQSVPDATKRRDSLQLIEMMKEITGEEPYMYGPSIIGFGNYHYVYESGHEGDAPLAGFSPRKTALTVYTASHFTGKDQLLKKLGKCKSSVCCLYIKKLADVDVQVLREIITESAKKAQANPNEKSLC